jgi:hypothetical protein
MKCSINEPLSEGRTSFIREYYKEKDADLICDTLTEEELRTIDSTLGLVPEKDYFHLAVVKRVVRNNPKLARDFDSYKSKDTHHYLELQANWLKCEQNLLAWELHREPTTPEFTKDFRDNQNGLRFKIFYCLKYPDKVEKIKNEQPLPKGRGIE